ncbi:hypothetical protein TARUN_1479 [Trichoderma arundinaceum]|uniref:Uncharacterized protein n=1 Tax=Trichoderma arundinaceum TaxID=490622 RepID=A0A395NX76_TRIAR|nr:hypothetical protein TARUN_1479 [Trichoderma arundinaceum]
MSGPMTSREDARKLVQTIAGDHGYVHEDDWNSMSPAVRDRVQKAMRSLEGIAGVAVTTLAKNLYTSDARFVFELLQNAEDNSFNIAREANMTPRVSFEVHPDHIIISCNEDGFEPKNLKAICAVGQSSKTGVQNGYVGEKGIGFKSVFMAAWKVYIQSGNFSFFFQHKRGDQGLGMISPIWYEPDEAPSQPGTKMRLLLGDGHSTIPPTQYQNILDQFDKLNESILLFMRNLEEIRISIFDEAGTTTKFTRFTKRRVDPKRIRLTKETATAKEEQDYYVVKHTAGNLEKNENRTYSEYEERTKAYASAEIALGFPLTEDSEPFIEYQDVFAYLPMKKAGFRFLINSDFVTKADRQDIVTTSDRNIGIRRGIAEAFIQAVLEFCNHPKLQYTWMRFLPDRNEHQFDPFWSQLVTLLEEKLKITPILRPRSETSLRLISDLRSLLNSQMDSHGDPLFNDVSPEKYLSKNYAWKDIDSLRKYGLSDCSASEIVSAIEQDLEAAHPRIHSPLMGDDWHTRAASYLTTICRYSESLRSRLAELPLIPVQNGEWRSATYYYDIYFPDTGGLTIPPDLRLNIVDPAAAQSDQRRKLFGLLGAQEANIPMIRERILNVQYEERFSTPNISSLVQQLQFVFLTDWHKAASEDKTKITIVTSENVKQFPYLTDVYLRDSNPFGPSALLHEAKNTDGLSVNFLHDSYINCTFEGKDNLNKSWEDWLCSYAGVRRHLRIISKDDRTELSKECLYVAHKHTDKFLGYLRCTWPQEGKDIESSLILTHQLRDVAVPIQGGGIEYLEKTYLPLPQLEQQWKRFSTPPEAFPILSLDEEVTRDTYAKDWGFLVSSLSVGAEDTIKFYLDMLPYIMRRYVGREITNVSRILDLYGVIYGKYRQYDGYQQLSPEECVWNGPESLSISAPLKARYEAISIIQSESFSSLTDFFTNVLGINDCDEKIICEQLESLRDTGSDDFERIHNLYSSLYQMLSKKKANEAKAFTKSKFTDSQLIYIRSDNCWKNISECLWSSATTIRSKKVLEKDYGQLRRFFVDILGVTTLNLLLIYEELLKLGESTPTVASVKEQLFAFNDHLQTVDEYEEITAVSLKMAKIFPVRYPGSQQNIQLCDGNTEFAIADRIHLESNFRPHIKMLGLTFDEIHHLEPFIKWLGFRERYLSRLVKETSKVGNNDPVLNLALGRSIRSKAQALCRVAKKYHSPRSRDQEGLQNLYRMLRQVKIFETDKISCVLYISQDGNEYTYEKSVSELHLQEHNTDLEIFIPQDEKRRERCLAHALPTRLFQWIIADATTKTSSGANGQHYLIVKDVLRENLELVSDILDEEGIVNVHIEDVDASDDDDSDGEDLASTKSAQHDASESNHAIEVNSQMAASSTNAPSSMAYVNRDEVSTIGVHQDIISASSHFSASRHSNTHLVQLTSLDASTQNIPASTSIQREIVSADLQYADLLSQVISTARRGLFPTKSVFDLDVLRTVLPSISSSNSNQNEADDPELGYTRIFPPLERDKMVGAAGELYVFELLKACNPSLPNFGIDNWKSTIRSYARKHPEYAAMEPWRGHETSDLVYHDTMGVFTKLLIDKCYLDASLQDARGSEDVVYIIFRVYNLGNRDLALHVYVDPAELEAKQELLFTPETYSVVPCV